LASDRDQADGARGLASAARSVVERLGPHPVTSLALDLDDDRDLGRWLVAACLLAASRDEGRALEAFRALGEVDLGSAGALASAPPGAARDVLEAAGQPKPERTAHQLSRACRSLGERHGGSLVALAGESETLEELGRRIAALGPGIGAATLSRFLRPLRERWPAAAELPLAPAARSAAVHLRLIDDGEDLEGEPGALRRALADAPDAPPLADVESALERLGRRACARERGDRCPMGRACPLRSGSASPD
jgi:hypothetical protein